MTTLTLHERTMHEAHLFAESLRAEREQRELCNQIIADHGAQLREFRLMVAGAMIAAGDGTLETEPQTVTNAAHLAFGEAVDWLAEAEARAADWLDWQRTQEDSRF